MTRVMRRSMIMHVLAIAALAAWFATSSLASSQSGGLKPSEAPSVVVGQHYFGDTSHQNNYGNYEYDFWKLPPLIAGDLLTVAWNWTSGQGNSLCVAENIDDYNWGQELCNGSDSFNVSNSSSARSEIPVKASSSSAYFEFYTCCNGGAYDFVVESIQHRVAVDLVRVFRINVVAVVRAAAVLGDSNPVPDGLRFTLTAVWQGHRAQFAAQTKAGKLAFAVRLPPSAHAKVVTFRVTRAQDPNYQAAKSALLRVKVA